MAKSKKVAVKVADDVTISPAPVAVVDTPQAPIELAPPPDMPAAHVKMEGAYDHSSVQVLRDREHIRKRPDNYIPDRATRGLHHLVYELVYNSVDEHLAGHCNNVNVIIHVDGSLSVTDNGRGIPVDMHPGENRPTLEVVMTVVGAGGKFDNNAYRVSAGLHGMGAKAVTALSELTRAEIRRDGKFYTQEYDRGLVSTPVKEIGASDSTGTRIHFWPDKEIFGEHTFEYIMLQDRLRELAFLNRGLSISLKDERIGKEEVTFLYNGGISEYVTFLNQGEALLHNPVYIFKQVEEVQVEVAFQYCDTSEERVRCYANNAYNPNGGTHMSGFRSAITRTLGAYGKANGVFKDIEPVGDDYRKGLTAIVNVQLPNPQFEAQTKVRLNNREIEGVVSSVVNEALGKYLEENPKEAKNILRKVVLTAEEREAEAKAREAIRKRKNILSGGGLPGKLLDCTSHGDETELFLVEGDSAGGSAESGRDRTYQAVLPLRGKPLNVEKARREKLLKNEEIATIMGAVGVDIGSDDITKLRYGKIVILTDADVDGQHIRTLLLTFFFRQMPKLIEEGHIYVARPPLFKVTQKKNIRFIMTAPEITGELTKRGLDATELHLLREGDPAVIQGESLLGLMQSLDRLESSLQIMERRGLLLENLIKLSADGELPLWHVKFGGKERWFHTVEQVDAYRLEEATRLGHDLIVGDIGLDEHGTDAADERMEAEGRFLIDEYPEIKNINRTLAKLKEEFEISASDLVPVKRIAGREPAPRFLLKRGEDQEKYLPQLREVGPTIRNFGSKGMTITRFKGLGEMNPEDLWATTLDPDNRTLLKVTMVDAMAAGDLFRILMGEESDKRREFIFEKGINVKEAIDF